MPRMLLAVAAALAVVVGCGSAENDPNLAAAAQKTEDTGSSRFAVTGTMSEESEKLDIGCAGEADYAARSVRVTCDYGRAGRMELIGVGNTSYMRGDVFGFGGGEDTWVRSTDDPESIADEISPQRLLAMLRSASRSTERVGEEQIRGVDTVRYRLVVNCGEAELVDCESGTAPVEVWVDGDGLVRRIAVEENASTTFAFEFFDFGADVVIEAPPAEEVVEMDEWFAPRPCQPDAGSPLTGRDVRGAMERQGLDFEERDECFAGQVAVFQMRDPGAGDGIVANCTVSPAALDSSTGIEVEGMRSAIVGNAQCAYSEDLADTMEKVVADLERQARE